MAEHRYLIVNLVAEVTTQAFKTHVLKVLPAKVRLASKRVKAEAKIGLPDLAWQKGDRNWK